MSPDGPISPEPIMHIASGFMATKHLFVANEIGVFSALANGPATLAHIAERTNTPERTLRIVLDATVALGLIDRTNGTYQNSPATQTYLSGAGAHDLRPFLRFWNHLSYPNWLHLEHAIRGTRDTAQSKEWSEETHTIFSEGVAAVTAGTALALAKTYDFSTHRRVLDLGGGTGSFLATMLRHHAHLHSTLFEIPQVIDVAKRQLAACPDAHKIALIAGDFFSDPIPIDHDAILIANVIHLLSPDRTRRLFSRVRECARPDTRLLLVDFWTNPTHTEPTFAALMAGEFLLVSEEGDVYSVDEMIQWLTDTGWRMTAHTPLAGPASLVTAAPA